MTAQETIDIFRNLARKFEKLSRKSLLGKLSLDDKTGFLKYKRMKLKRIRSNKDKEDMKREGIEEYIDDEEGEDVDGDDDKTISQGYNDESDRKEDIVSDKNNEDHSQIYKGMIEESKNDDDDIIYIPEAGWEIKLHMCELLIEMGPFITKSQASKVISYLKENQSLISSMELNQRSQWIDSLSKLLQFIIHPSQ